ncbi:MAG: HEAT repeat domain-containing protein [bacterium]
MRCLRFSAVLCGLWAGLISAPERAEAFEWSGKLRVTVAKLHHPKQAEKLKALRALAQFPMKKVRRYLLAATQDLTDDTFRVTAARMLVEHKVRAVLPVLVDWLSDFELEVRVEAARLLGEMGDASAVGPLLRTFGDFENKVRMASVLALGRIGSRRAITGILGRLNDPNVKVRRAAIKVLADLTDPRAVIPLLGKLTDPSREVREAALKSLAKIGDPRAVPPILRLLKDPAEQVRVAAIAALGNMRSTASSTALINLFNRSTSVTERRSVVQALGRLGTPLARRTLVKALFDSTLSRAVRDALVLAGGAIVPQLARTLRSPRIQPHLATQVVQILRDIADRRASSALVREFHRGRVSRKLVVEALTTCGDSKALVPLLVVVSGKDKTQMRLALAALEHIVDRRAIMPLLPVLKSKDRTVRLLAARILGKLRAHEAVPDLLRMLDKDSTVIREASAYALGNIGDKRVGPQLVPLLYAKEASLRRASFNALATLKPQSVLKELIKTAADTEIEAVNRAYALDAVGAILRGSRSTLHAQAILRLARDPNQRVATAALTSMGAIHNPAFGPWLAARFSKAHRRMKLKVLEVASYFPSATTAALLGRALRSKNWKLRVVAAWGMGRLGRHADRSVLLHAAEDKHPGVRTNAIGALATLQQKSALASLRPLLRGSDLNPSLLANVVLALGRLGDRSSAEDIARLLTLDLTNRYLEHNIIRALFALGWTAKRITRLLEARGDEQLLRIARRLAVRKPAAKRTWIGIDLVDAKGHRKHGLPLLLIFPDGMVRWAFTDERGQIYEEQIAPGTVNYEYVRLPKAPIR